MAYRPIGNTADWSKEEGTNYLICFDRDVLWQKDPEGAAKGNGAEHYIGWTSQQIEKDTPVEQLAEELRRFVEHKAGRSGAKLVLAALDAGCELRLARVWPNTTRLFERRMKNHGHHHGLCPIHNPNSWQDKFVNER